MDLIRILVLFICIAYAHGNYHSQPRPWIPKVAKVTNLHFFLREIQRIGAANDTVFVVASSNNNRVSVVDDLLTVGPEDNSKVIGNAKGLSVTPSNRDGVPTVVLSLDFGFTSGKFNGSSISVFSRAVLSETVRELAVVGGRGKFKMATGFAYNRVYFSNQTHLSLEWNMTVIY